MHAAVIFSVLCSSALGLAFAGDAPDYTVPIGPQNPAVWPPQEMASAMEKPWSDFYGKTGSQVFFYVPDRSKPVRGVLFWYDITRMDGREMADHWNFAMIYLGGSALPHFGGTKDKRNPWVKAGQKPLDSAVTFTYLDQLANHYKRPELKHAPIVSFMGQDGCLAFRGWAKAKPERLIGLAWAWANAEDHQSWLTTIPLVHADENRSKAAPRSGLTPPPNLLARSVQYGHGHGVMSGMVWSMFQLDRYVTQRYPADLDPSKGPVTLKPVDKAAGWAGDFAYQGNWAPIAPIAEAKDMADPIFLPDAYSAWSWRAFHTANPEIQMTSPAVTWKPGYDKDVGLGRYAPGSSTTAVTLAATSSIPLTLLEFYSGDIKLGEAKSEPWSVAGIMLKPGIHCLHAIGTAADGRKSNARATFYRVK